MRTILALVLSLALASAAVAQAAKKGPNGGLVAGKGGHETELIVSPTELTVYILDDGKLHSIKGATVRGVIQQGGKNEQVTFTVVDGKKLVARLAAPLSKGAIVVLSGKDDHGHSISSRYVID